MEDLQRVKICRECGATNAPAGKYCFKCGAKMGGEDASGVLCEFCATVNSAAARYCFKCGQTLKPAKVFCNNCGTANSKGDVYCSGCGQRIIMAPAEPKAESKPEMSPEPKAVESAMSEPVIAREPVKLPPVYRGEISEPAKVRPKQNYRIQMLVMFLLLGGMIALLTQTFFQYSTTISIMSASEFSLTASLNGIASTMIVPFNIMGEKISGEVMKALSFLFTPESSVSADLVSAGISKGVSSIFAYVLFGVIALTVVILIVAAVAALIRFFSNKPYGQTRMTFFYLFLINLIVGGIALASKHIEAVTKFFTSEDGGGFIFEPDLFYYIFTGGLLLLYIMSRVARIKNPDPTRRQMRKAAKKQNAAEAAEK
jgi:ribosomal protein L40E